MTICGIDGCRGGWIAAVKQLETGEVALQRETWLADLLTGASAPAVAAVDIPIGLPNAGARVCDQAARRLLGPKRASSVFPAPIRTVLAAQSYAEACELRLAVEGKAMSKQAYHILPKIREMDEFVRWAKPLQTEVREAHPEVSFAMLAGGFPMRHKKKSPEGRRERIAWLEPLYGPWLAAALSQRRPLGCAEDDILDAFITLWTSERILQGKAQTLPDSPPSDRFGLRMEIVA